MFQKHYKLLSLVFYFASLFVFTFQGSEMIGWFALLSGWMGLFGLMVFIGVAWLANLAYFINVFILSRKNKRTAYIFSLVTFGMGLFTLGIRRIPRDAAGNEDEVIVGAGFVVWILSFTILAIGLFLEHKRAQTTH